MSVYDSWYCGVGEFDDMPLCNFVINK